MAFDSSADVAANERMMTEAFQSVVSGAVTFAVRSTKFHGEDIAEGDVMGMMDNDLCSVGATVDAVTRDLLDKMMQKLGETDAAVTMFYGESVEEAERQPTGRAVGGSVSGCGVYRPKRRTAIVLLLSFG